MAFPNETVTKDGSDILDSDLLLKSTYTNNNWYFEDSSSGYGYWTINNSVSLPDLEQINYQTTAFPSQTATKDGTDILDSDLLLKQTFLSNQWYFENENDGYGYWSINSNSLPDLLQINYQTTVWPFQTTSKDGSNITDSNLKKQETYENNTWNFTTIWSIQENKYFPRFIWEPAIYDTSRLIIGLNVIPLNIIEIKVNEDISFLEDKVNSNSTPSHLTFCGNKRKKINISGYTDFTNYEIIKNAVLNRTSIISHIYPPKNLDIDLTDGYYWYISNFNNSFKIGDFNNFYFSLEITRGRNIE